MKFRVMRRLGLPIGMTREQRRERREEGETRRQRNAMLTAASERIEARLRRSIQSTLDRYEATGRAR